jgi:NAD(P)-dependent dehydrogenase (short-subunit alcohol dehydrogenase family)
MDAKMLDGKVAIVSGASYGMGQTMAELFAREGAKVVMTARGQEKLDSAVAGIRAKGYDVTGVVADNKKLEDVQRVIQTALDVYGDLDIVINNAAIGEQKMIDETDDEWLEHVYQTNVFGPFRFIREALKIFMPKNEGCIINISSIWGSHGASCESVYSSTKHAIIGLTRSLAAEFAPSGIRVNCVAPGVIETDMIQALGNETLEQLRQEMPFRRFGTPEEVAESVWHLAKAEYITGQILTVDGGFLF